jgi:hypothetical protein
MPDLEVYGEIGRIPRYMHTRLLAAAEAQSEYDIYYGRRL